MILFNSDIFSMAIRGCTILVLTLFLNLYANAQVGEEAVLDSTVIEQLIVDSKNEVDPQKRRELLIAALQHSKQIGFDRGMIESLDLLANASTGSENNIQRLRYLLELQNIYVNKNYSRRLAETLINIGRVYADERLHGESLKYFRRAKDIKQQTELREDLTEALMKDLGAAYSHTGKPDSAYQQFNQLLQINPISERPVEHLNLLRSIVESYQTNNRPEKALEYNQRIADYLLEFGSREEKILILNNLGYNYNQIDEYATAVDYFYKADSLLNDQDREGRYVVHNNIGVAYFNLGAFDDAITSLLNARTFLAPGERAKRAQMELLLANAYLKSKDYYNALHFAQLMMDDAGGKVKPELLSEAYFTMAEIYAGLYEYDQALNFYEKHLSLRDSLVLEERLRQERLLQEHVSLERAEKEVKLLLVNQELQTLAINQLELEKNNLELEAAKKANELSLAVQERQIAEANLKNEQLESQRALQALQLTRQQLLNEQQERELADLAQKEQLQQVELARKQAEIERDQQEISLLTKEQEIQALELDKQRDFRRFAYGLGGLLSLVLLLILAGLIFARKTNRKLSQQNVIISAERKKSEELLLNILPKETAQELKETGFAKPRYYKSSSVLFTDFSGFTRVAASMEPQELIKELNECFLAFDEIIENHGLEKIKTIGDAYMCAGGIPKSNDTHPVDAINAGIEMVRFMNDRVKEKEKLGQPYWNMRVGVHSGPLVAGVVGKKKFIYDIWGDTVNTASRMESNGDKGRINISSDTYDLIKDVFDCEYRGKIDVKNKGLIDMYFVQA